MANREHFRKNPVQIQDLILCQSWPDVETLLEAVERDLGTHDDIRFFSEFRFILALFCPRYDYRRDSVQARGLEYFGEEAQHFFQRQESARLFNGFELACEFAFGSDWRDHPEELQSRRLFREIDVLGMMPKLLGDHAEALQGALVRGDAALFERIAKHLRKSSMIYVPTSPPQHSSTAIHQLDIKPEICRFWTNPDIPLHFMMDPAIKQALRYLTGGGYVSERALQQRILRMGLKRYSRRPIQEMHVKKDEATGKLRFESFKFASYIVPFMKDVPTSLGYGETGAWTAAGRSVGGS